MALLKSISGIRGTIGGKPGENLTPLDIVKFTSAYGTWLGTKAGKPMKVIIGRDARQSGPMVSNLISNTLLNMGIDVTDLGLASTPTVELAVQAEAASGGIIVTASHNPSQWNALKLLNSEGEFLSASDGAEVLRLAEAEDFKFESYENWGKYKTDDSWDKKHIDLVCRLSAVDCEIINRAGFRIVVDAVNSVGGRIIPALLRELGVHEVKELNCVPDGKFSHNPEPLPENLVDISAQVKEEKADLGIVVDPDVDRLAIVCEDGTMFGEEYTLVAVADYILSRTKGNTVSNMSSTRALQDVTERYGCKYHSSAVGEVNVVEEMKRRNAVIGGEGNGGVIYPVLHYGRDALAGIALFLTHLAGSKMKCSELRRLYPDYFMAKKKVELKEGADIEVITTAVKKAFSGSAFDERDGLKVELEAGWVQLRKSNTEPIIRVYSEAVSAELADNLAERVIKIVKNS